MDPWAHLSHHPRAVSTAVAVTCLEGRDKLPPLGSNRKTGELLAEPPQGMLTEGPTSCPDRARKGGWRYGFHKALEGQ